MVILNISNDPTSTCDEDAQVNQKAGLDCWHPQCASAGRLRPTSSADWQKGTSLIKLENIFFNDKDFDWFRGVTG